jgi:hypothetical protein
MHRIDVDCRRTDRTHPIFAPSGDDGDDKTFQSDSLHQHGSQARSNTNVEKLGAILLTYNFYEKELGEVLFHDFH